MFATGTLTSCPVCIQIRAPLAQHNTTQPHTHSTYSTPKRTSARTHSLSIVAKFSGRGVLIPLTLSLPFFLFAAGISVYDAGLPRLMIM